MSRRPTDLVPPDPELWERPEVRAILAARNIGGLFAILQQRGFSQRRLAALVGMSQSEICEIKAGRKVGAYDVLLRVAEGLHVPLVYMGLAHPPPLNERAEPAPSQSSCVVLRYAVAEFLDRVGPPETEALCRVLPCPSSLFAAIVAGFAIAIADVDLSAREEVGGRDADPAPQMDLAERCSHAQPTPQDNSGMDGDPGDRN
jgi:transcriptional regulator with XRE-family HTH domain